jgi:predicted transcriptional regulator
MSSLLVELTANIVSSHAASVEMTSDELLQEIQKVYIALKNLDSDTVVEETAGIKDQSPAINPKKSIQKDQIVCLICGKGGFKTLSRHLNVVHDIKPREYRKQFNLPAGTALAAKSYSESRRQAALENNLGEKLALGRAKRMANYEARKATPAKTTKPAAARGPKVPKATSGTRSKKK